MLTSPALLLTFDPDAAPEERDLASAALLDFDTAAVHEHSDTEWRVFFRRADERDRAVAAMAGRWRVAAADVEADDWARRSQQNLRAVTVGRIVVAPPWDVPANAPPDAIVIVIEPSTGFGTGHHATTRLCLAALQRVEVAGRRVLDVGTGSGVLAIAAARLGARDVLAVDHDPDALATARENVSRNGVTLDVRQVDLQAEPLPPADIVLANLTGGMLQRNAATLAALARGGHLIVSGLLTGEVEAVASALAGHAALLERHDEDGWSSLTLAS